MIILDLSQVMLANLSMQYKKFGNELDENILRHMVLNTIRANYVKFKNEYGEMVIACDWPGGSWRKQFFPYYKARRKEDREASTMDWDAIFKALNKIRDELKENFKFRVVMVEKAEADDIIGTLCEKFGTLGLNYTDDKIMILSGDKDFRQLQVYANVEQYDPTRKKVIRENQPELYLKEHIYRGDKGDGIPSVLENDDSLILKNRQKQIRQTMIDKWLETPIEDQPERFRRNYFRNETLVDLKCTPSDIKEKIIEAYESEAGKTNKNLRTYLINNRLRVLLESMNDFV